MKVFFVGDNRTYLNWGGRGASIALYQLLSEHFEITGTAKNDGNMGYVNTFVSPEHYWFFLHCLLNRKKRRFFDWYIKFEKLFGAKDYITEDPSESIDNLISHMIKYPELLKIYEQASGADLLVINGEGDIVFTTPPRRVVLFLLAMIELGIRLNKKVAFVNTMISDCPETGRNIKTLDAARSLLSKCCAVSVRDPQSLEYVEKEMPEVNARYIPDSLFSWFPLYEDLGSILAANGDFVISFPEKSEFLGKLDFSKPYICLGGSALAAKYPEESYRCYAKLFDGIRDLGYPVYLTENDSPDSFLLKIAKDKNAGIVPVETPILASGAILAKARLFISGRYHPAIFASLGGTPCIFLGSSAHKMYSLQRVLEYANPKEFSALPGDADIAGILSIAKHYLKQGETIREEIKKVAKKRCDEAKQIVKFIEERL